MRRAIAALLTLSAALAAGCGRSPADPPAAGPANPAAEAPAPPAPPAESDGAVPFGGHRYKALEEDVTWHEAKKRCETMGGHLAIIETPEEQAFIARLADGRYLYLGATDEAQEGVWLWVDGRKVDYAAWMDGQPNNYGGDENCLATYDGGEWVDVADSGDGFWMPTGFICEWDR